MKHILLTIFYYLLFSMPAFSEEIGIVAVVDNAIVSTKDVNDRVKLVAASSQTPLSKEVQKKLFPAIMQSLIDERLYAQEAERLNITVSEEDIAQTLRSIELKNNLNAGGLDNWLKKQGIPKNSLIEQVKAQILWTKIVRKKIQPRIKVSNVEMQESVEHLSSGAGEKELLISEIALPITSESDKDTVRKKAETIVKDIRSNTSFEVAAKQYSASQTAANGGKIGWVKSSNFPPSLIEEIIELAEGGITNPIYTENGYYIIKLHKKRDALTPLQYETEVHVKQVFVPSSEPESAKTLLNKTALSIKSCDSFNKHIKPAFPDASLDTLSLKIKDLGADIQSNVLKLPIDSTAVITSSAGTHLFTMCERNQPVSLEVNSADEGRVKDILIQQKTEMQAKHYLRDLRRQALIEIRGE